MDWEIPTDDDSLKRLIVDENEFCFENKGNSYYFFLSTDSMGIINVVNVNVIMNESTADPQIYNNNKIDERDFVLIRSTI